jgi:hypothetical protein
MYSTWLGQVVIQFYNTEIIATCACGVKVHALRPVQVFSRLNSHLYDCPLNLQQRISKDPNVAVADIKEQGPPVQESGETPRLHVSGRSSQGVRPCPNDHV